MADQPINADTRANYARAESYLPWNVAKLVFNTGVTPHWIGETDRFWYRRSSRDGTEFVVIDPANDFRQPAFDHERLGGGAVPGIRHLLHRQSTSL